MALYSDRAGWAFHTPKAKGPVDKKHLTQVGRALAHLGVEHIPAYSPQARGRSERLNRTFQDRLVNELRVAGIMTVTAANVYLREVFLPQHNETFSHPPRDAESAWVALGDIDLDQILCHEETRTVGEDNTVASDGLALQISKQPGAAPARGSRSSSVDIWTDGIRCGAAHSGWDSSMPLAGLWTLPCLWDGRRSRPPTRHLDRRSQTPAGPPRPQASL